LKVTVAFVALALASYPAWVEHKARLAGFVAQPGPALPSPEAPSPEPAPGFAEVLTPSPDILDQVKGQVADKPDFDAKSKAYEDLIQNAARRHKVSPALIKAVIQAESRFNQSAVSSQGAVGLMQVLPSTARSMGVSSPYEPHNNINAGVLYLKQLLNEFDDDEYLAIAAYNCGPDAIRRYGNAMPPYRETKSFVAKVMRYYQSYIDT
jgi:soluble lytic murein transglycosylase-like protein